MTELVHANTTRLDMPPDLERDFLAGAILLPDQEQALNLVKTQAYLQYEIAFGAQIKQLERENEEAKIRYERSKQVIEQQEKLLLATSPIIKTAEIREAATDKRSPFRFVKWAKDFLIGFLTFVMGGAVVVMGAANVYSIIMASGTPVFLEEPHLAMMLSALLPIGSVALKFFSNLLSDYAKKRYMHLLYGAMAASLFSWIVLFGFTFGSAASGFDWESLGQDKGLVDKGVALTIVQLIAEMLVGAALFQTTSDIWATYAPTTTALNPAVLAMQKNLDAMNKPHGERKAEVDKSTALLTALQNGRETYANKQVLLYMREAARIYGAPELSSKPNRKKESYPMKHFMIFVAMLLSILSTSITAQARTLIIGLSPVLEEKAQKAQTADILKFLSENLRPGETVDIFDADNIRRLGTFEMPEKSSYHAPKALLQYNRATVTAILGIPFANEEQIAQSIRGAVKIPQFLAFLSQNYGPFTEDTRIVVLGSPIYVDTQTPEWDMRGGRWFSDGHFDTEPEQSVFSTRRQKDWLKGAKIYIGFPDRDWIVNESYERLVRRMYTLFIETQGGELSAFTDERATLLDRVSRGSGALPHDFKVDKNDAPGSFVMIARENR
ncbi:MAG: hypothetical protein KDI65_03865 [Alphaproteobacteria bacterium]|nr:hypothetical protein [Alphaproteobacteria bacterium]